MLQFLLVFLRFKFEILPFGNQKIFRQKLDHFNLSDNLYFDQYYYENNTCLDHDHPSIVIYIGGEASMRYDSSIPSSPLFKITK